MRKKGQVTILIIIAIVVIIGIILFFFLRSTSGKENLGQEYFKERGLEPTVNNIQSFVIDCLEENSKDALIRIGVQGGYHNPPSSSYDLEWAFVPYYYDSGSINQPDKAKVESELASYIDSNIDDCVSEINFENFNLKYEPSTTKATIFSGSTKFQSTLPIVIESDGSSVNFNLKNHPVTLNSSLNEIIEVATFVTESHLEDPDLMCINCITEMAEERELYVDFIAFEPDTTLVMILENRTMEQPYVFEFLNRYDGGEESI